MPDALSRKTSSLAHNQTSAGVVHYRPEYGDTPGWAVPSADPRTTTASAVEHVVKGGSADVRQPGDFGLLDAGLDCFPGDGRDLLAGGSEFFACSLAPLAEGREFLPELVGSCHSRSVKHLTSHQPVRKVLYMNWTQNYVGRCKTKGCKHSTCLHHFGAGQCPELGPYRLEQVIGVEVPEVKCGPRCTNAVGPSCDCSCGGHNHGIGHAA